MISIYLNGRILPEAEGHLSPADAGFLYGAGLYETLRCRHGRVFHLADHLDRLFFSAAKLGLNIPLDRSELSAAVDAVLAANGLDEARVRITVSSGALGPAATEAEPTVLIKAVPFSPYPEAYYRRGILVVLCPWRQNPADPLAGHKTTSGFARMLALRQAQAKRAAEALWFTGDGHLAEGCVSNVFLVRDGVLATPPLETPVLAGVARQTVCHLAVAAGLDLQERPLSIEDLLGAQEVFLTNVIMELLPVTAVERHTVGDGTVGAVTQQLHARYQEEFERVCGEDS